MEVLGSLQKAMLLEKEKSSMKARLPGKPWSGSLLVAAQARAASSDAGQASLPLLPTSAVPLLPVPPNSPSRTLQLLLVGSGAPYMSVHKIAGAAQAGQQQHVAMILYRASLSLTTWPCQLPLFPTFPHPLQPLQHLILPQGSTRAWEG